jgi:hypothetical protein
MTAVIKDERAIKYLVHDRIIYSRIPGAGTAAHNGKGIEVYFVLI